MVDGRGQPVERTRKHPFALSRVYHSEVQLPPDEQQVRLPAMICAEMRVGIKCSNMPVWSLQCCLVAGFAVQDKARWYEKRGIEH